jgi:hypothetical protein
MKKYIVIAVLLVLLASCRQSAPPVADPVAEVLVGYTVRADEASLATTFTVGYDDQALTFVGLASQDSAVFYAANAQRGRVQVAKVAADVSATEVTLLFSGTEVSGTEVSGAEVSGAEVGTFTLETGGFGGSQHALDTRPNTQQGGWLETQVAVPSDAVLEAAFANSPLGDFDNDQTFEFADVVAILNIYLENTDINSISDYQLYHSDINCDNEVSFTDVIAALNKFLGNSPPTLQLCPTSVTADGSIGSNIVLAGNIGSGTLPAINVSYGASDPQVFTAPSGSPGQAYVVDAATPLGTYNVTFDAGTAGSETVSVLVTSSTANTPPTISAIDNQTLNEDAQTSPLEFTIGDIQTPVDQLIVNASSSDTIIIPNNALTLGGAGANRTIVVDPAANQYTSGTPVTITVSVQDLAGSVAEETFEVTVNPVNDPPTFLNAGNQSLLSGTNTEQVIPNWAFNINVGANEPTQNVAGFDVTIVSGQSLFANAPTVGSNGTLSYTPTGNDGVAVVNVSLRDNGGVGNGGSDTSATQQFTVTVSDNLPPTITPIPNQTINEDSTTGILNFTVNDSEDGAVTGGLAGLQVTANSSNTSIIPQSGIVLGPSPITGSARTITVTPAADQFGGPVVITVIVEDSRGATAQTSFQVTVNPVNDAPDFDLSGSTNLSTITGYGEQVIPGFLTNFDPGPANEASQTRLETIINGVPSGVFAVSPTIDGTGTLRFTPGSNAGIANMTVQVRDSGGTANGGVDLSAGQAFTINVAANSVPTGTIADVTARSDDANQTIDLVAAFSDPDQDDATLEFAVTSVAPEGVVTVTANNSTDQLTLDFLADGTANVTVTATDIGGATGSVTFQVIVNTPPMVGSINDITVNEGAPNRVIDLNDVFSNADPLTYTVTQNSDPTVVATSITGSNLTLDFDVPGTSTITVQAEEPGGETAEVTFNVRVNAAPTVVSAITNITANVSDPDQTFELSTRFNDPDDPTLTYTIVQNTFSNVVNARLENGAQLGSLLRLDFLTPGVSQITLQAVDSNGLTVSNSFQVTVVDNQPTLTTAIPDLTGNEGESESLNLADYFADVEDDAAGLQLSYRVTNNSNLNAVSSNISGTTLNLNFLEGGIAQLTVTATDSRGQSISTSFFVTVNGDPKVLRTLQDLILNQEDLPFAIDLTEFFTDAEVGGAGLTYSVIGNTDSNIIGTNVAGVTLNLNAGTNIAEGGMTTMTIRATDPSGQSIDQTFNITVTNQAPTVSASIGARSAPAGGTTTINLDLYFSDFGDLDYTVIGNTNTTVVTNGIGSAVPGTVLTITVDAGATSGQTATITVEAEDAGGLTAQQSFVVTVQ